MLELIHATCKHFNANLEIHFSLAGTAGDRGIYLPPDAGGPVVKSTGHCRSDSICLNTGQIVLLVVHPDQHRWMTCREEFVLLCGFEEGVGKDSLLTTL